jgi:hypothetical protein
MDKNYKYIYEKKIDIIKDTPLINHCKKQKNYTDIYVDKEDMILLQIYIFMA